MTAHPFKRYMPEKRLAKLLQRPGGVSLAEALSRADQRLEAVRAQSLAVVDELIETMSARFNAGETAAELYPMAAETFSIAGTFGLAEVSKAAESLAGILLARVEAGDVERIAQDTALGRIVGVHVDALRTLRRVEFGGDQKAREAVLEGLKRVAARAA